jgi:carboxyl-terminal processing protease
LTRKQTSIKTLWLWQKRKIDGTIITEYQQLLAALQKRRNTVRQKEEIKGLIIDEIIKRYQYQEGFINIL